MSNVINHAERAHALLSPSASHRWIGCTMSVPLNEQYPDTSSEFAAEGTAAHELAEWYLRLSAGLPHQDNEPLPTNDTYDVDAMVHHAEEYAAYVCEQRTGANDTIGVEMRVQLNDTVGDMPLNGLCYGTADCIMLTDDGATLHVIDYKYGKGVEVSAENNPQLMLYAMMALTSAITPEQANKVTYIKLHIYQPRIGNISMWEVSKATLLSAFYADMVRPTIARIISEQYSLSAGEHCRWCKHKVNCKQYALTYFDPSVQAMRLEGASLDKAKISEVLALKDDLIKWLNELGDKVITDIINGEVYDGYKVVEGRSVRKITDEQGAINYLRSQGYKEVDIFKPLELQNLTSLSKLMGKKAFDTEMAQFVTKPKGKPTLAPIDDKRPAYDGEIDAHKDLSLFED